MLAEQLKSDMEHRDHKLFFVIQSVLVDSTASTASPPSMTPTEISSITPSQHQENAVHTDPVQLEMLKILQKMQKSMFTQTQAPQQQNGSQTCTTRRPQRKTPDNATYARK